MSGVLAMKLNLGNLDANANSSGSAKESNGQGDAGSSEKPKVDPALTGLAVGDSVSVKYRGKEWRKATVVGVRPEGSYDVAFSNNEHENGVPPSMLRQRDSPRSIDRNSPVSCLATASRAP